MAELGELNNEIPASILGNDGGGVATDDNPPDPDPDLNDEEDLDQGDGGGEGTDEEESDADGAAAAAGADGEGEGEGEDDDYVEDLGEEDEPAPGSLPATKQPEVTDEGQYILNGLSKIKTSIIMPTADGKGEVKEVEVYGWGDLPKNMQGFATPYEQGVFTASAQNQELKARDLQGEFRQNKVKSDTEAYTMRENQAIARDLRTLRQEGIFPKFKGVPGSSEFNGSDGAKEFDRVVAFMNEQNDESGQAAQKGNAFYHISFRQAYRMLHPEQFDAKAKGRRQAGDRAIARRAKGGTGGTRPDRNVQTGRVSNINDLAGEFESFTGQSGQ